MATAMIPKVAMPPRTPPIMAPILLFELLLSFAAGDAFGEIELDESLGEEDVEEGNEAEEGVDVGANEEVPSVLETPAPVLDGTSLGVVGVSDRPVSHGLGS